MSRSWTETEIEFLRKNAKKMTYQQVAEKLGRTMKSVGIKASRMNIKGGTWTEDEDEFIENYAAHKTIEWMAKKLHRTPSGLRVHMLDIGIGDLHIEKGSYSAKALSEIIGVSHETVRRWIQAKELPAVKSSRYLGVERQHMHYHILPEDFWNWAEKNRDLVNFNSIERHALPPEPAWLDEERRKQFHRPTRMKIWGSEEDQRLLNHYYKEGLLQREVAERMGRTISSVEKRLKRLREKNTGAN